MFCILSCHSRIYPLALVWQQNLLKPNQRNRGLRSRISTGKVYIRCSSSTHVIAGNGCLPTASAGRHMEAALLHDLNLAVA